MELIERYLQAVKFLLPTKQREDVIKELSGDLLSQAEEKESQLGRPLNEDEQVALLRQFGPPPQLAGQYRRQQYLIGPTLYSIYWKVLGFGWSVALVVSVIASLATAASGRPVSTSLAPLFRYPAAALMVFAWVTLAFAACEFFGAGFVSHVRSADWDPRKLPPLAKAGKVPSRTESASALVLVAIVTVWWLAALRNPFLIFGPGVAFITFAPVWVKLFPLFVVATFAEVARYSLDLARPTALRVGAAARLLTSALGLVILYLLIRAGEIVAVADPANATQLDPLVRAINYWGRLALIVAAIVTLLHAFRQIVRMMGSRPDQAQHASLA